MPYFPGNLVCILNVFSVFYWIGPESPFSLVSVWQTYLQRPVVGLCLCNFCRGHATLSPILDSKMAGWNGYVGVSVLWTLPQFSPMFFQLFFLFSKGSVFSSRTPLQVDFYQSSLKFFTFFHCCRVLPALVRCLPFISLQLKMFCNLPGFCLLCKALVG